MIHVDLKKPKFTLPAIPGVDISYRVVRDKLKKVVIDMGAVTEPSNICSECGKLREYIET